VRRGYSAVAAEPGARLAGEKAEST